MMLIEVDVPTGVLDVEERKALGRQLMDALMPEGDSHHPDVLNAERQHVQALVRENDAWLLAQRPAADPADPPRYFVRVTVPGSWRKDMSPTVVEVVTGVLAEVESAAGRDPGHLRDAPHAMVHVVGVSEGSVGLYGKAMSHRALEDHATASFREALLDGRVEAPGPGKLLDPVCGMVVDDTPTAFTLEHDGTRHGFCSLSCRRFFADEYGVALGG